MIESTKAVSELFSPLTGKILKVNDALVNFYEYPRSELLGSVADSTRVIASAAWPVLKPGAAWPLMSEAKYTL